MSYCLAWQKVEGHSNHSDLGGHLENENLGHVQMQGAKEYWQRDEAPAKLSQ